MAPLAEAALIVIVAMILGVSLLIALAWSLIGFVWRTVRESRRARFSEKEAIEVCARRERASRENLRQQEQVRLEQEQMRLEEERQRLSEKLQVPEVLRRLGFSESEVLFLFHWARSSQFLGLPLRSEERAWLRLVATGLADGEHGSERLLENQAHFISVLKAGT